MKKSKIILPTSADTKKSIKATQEFLKKHNSLIKYNNWRTPKKKETL